MPDGAEYFADMGEFSNAFTPPEEERAFLESIMDLSELQQRIILRHRVQAQNKDSSPDDDLRVRFPWVRYPENL